MLNGVKKITPASNLPNSSCRENFNSDYNSNNASDPNNILNNEHSINKYIDTIKEFNKFNKFKNINNLFLIKYEDMFENNFNNLKCIFDKIGFRYNDTIFDNSKYINKVQFGNNLKIPNGNNLPLFTFFKT